MSRIKTVSEACGCKYQTEPNGRESWSEMCVPHAAEHRALHAEARRQHEHETRERALAEEFT